MTSKVVSTDRSPARWLNKVYALKLDLGARKEQQVRIVEIEVDNQGHLWFWSKYS